jgi:hypothetical protein
VDPLLKEMLKAGTRTAVERLLSIIEDPDTPAMVAVLACNALLGKTLGKKFEGIYEGAQQEEAIPSIAGVALGELSEEQLAWLLERRREEAARLAEWRNLPRLDVGRGGGDAPRGEGAPEEGPGSPQGE